MTPDHAKFRRRLATQMQQHGLTQTRLAKRVGVTQSHVCRWINGSWPTAPHLAALSLALGVSVDYLLGLRTPATTTEGEE